MKRIVKTSVFSSVLMLLFLAVISCEKDFADVGTTIVKNNKFSVKDTVLEVVVTAKEIDAVRGDNISIGSGGEFLLGVYANNDYEKIEASIISQLQIPSSIIIKNETDTTTVTSIMDNAFLKLPYIATSTGDDSEGKPTFRLDSVLGTSNTGVTLKVYRNLTYLSTLNPLDPSKQNSYSTDFDYEEGELLTDPDYKFIPNANDTVYRYDRHLLSGDTFKDSLKLTNSVPFLTIPLNKTLMKQLFYDEFESDKFNSQEAFNDYFRGLIIETSGDESTLVPFNLGSRTLAPSLEINYTNTVVLNSTGAVIDTIAKTSSFPLAQIQNRHYTMSPPVNSTSTNQVVIQGAAGKSADVKILQGNQIDELKAKNWLINDASLTFYIDQSRDTTAVPLQLFLYKEYDGQSSQIKDSYTEGLATFGGGLQKENYAKDRYQFRITDYVSDILDGSQSNNPNLVLKVYNTPTDNPQKGMALDTIVRNYNWNPRAVTLFNNLPSNGEIRGTRKAQLKISYSEKNN